MPGEHCARQLAMRHRKSAVAFTLLELVLVMLVVSLMLALAAPALSGWSRGARLRDTSDQFRAAAHFARSQAISTAVTHRIEIDPAAGGYLITRLDGEQFVPVSGEFGRLVRPPLGVGIELTRDDGSPAGLIEFTPTGRITPARVRVTADTGETIHLAASSPAQLFEQVTP
jgi:type II secretory pathway pseudopilin PulG